MSNTTPGPEDEGRVQEPEPSVEPDAPASEPAEAEPNAESAAEPINSEPVEPAESEPAESEPAPDEPSESGPAETVTAAYATQDEPASTWAAEPAPVAEPAPAPVTPVYVTAPTPPKAKGNRGIGILIALLSTIAYAIVYAAFSLGYFALNFDGDSALRHFDDYLVSWAFWVPVAAFFVAFALLVAIVNRGGWWAYVLGGFIVAVAVYFAYLGGALLQVQAWTLTVAQVNRLVAQLWTNPLMLGAAIVAREVTIWFGAWIASRGKRVRQRNLDARRDFDREVAEGPLAQRASASTSWSDR